MLSFFGFLVGEVSVVLADDPLSARSQARCHAVARLGTGFLAGVNHDNLDLSREVLRNCRISCVHPSCN